MMALSLVPAQQTTGPASCRPTPQDIKLTCWVQPDAPLGTIEVQLGLGKGSGGPGRQSVMNDVHAYADTLRRIASHLQAYAHDYEAAARGEEPSGLADDDEIPTGPAVALLRPCADCGKLTPWNLCGDCLPF